ncbi:hypothetical protein CROQUDRAFT_65711 [Cronartium quercuum f. sp. fusiforme G11]|uniref:EKC/KEOPS complex subunit BUD32 n=1 Tax=Cronartium quercuum f. sp. fusiforme G11 TaxID=708437 RepID=A0A9P6T9S0_9BASI|nr:hypothetical protein CROQUDRAFT_65711 [Cronartium quercuum f. sp. fusiforme G11]
MFSHSNLIKQGAEAKIYKSSLIPSEPPILIKHRFPKTYRHPSLNQQLTTQRLTFEARALTRAAKAGLDVPGLRGIDLKTGVLLIEFIDGFTVRDVLLDPKSHQNLTRHINHILHQIGIQLAKLHSADLIHGDLTTSNMIIRLPTPEPTTAQVVLIDFGLSFVSSLVEDKAVDLYVLERAFLSTHPHLSITPSIQKPSSEHFERVLEAYGSHLPTKDWNLLQTRLANVRARGRKRTMVG